MDGNIPLDNSIKNVAEEFVQGSQNSRTFITGSAVAETITAPRCAIRAAASKIIIHATTAGNDLVEDDTRTWELATSTAICNALDVAFGQENIINLGVAQEPCIIVVAHQSKECAALAQASSSAAVAPELVVGTAQIDVFDVVAERVAILVTTTIEISDIAAIILLR
ncbi:hypothetical protein ACH5RR_025699 [Cinchona calisaya]|uniref:Uncharacterized protein n=1 Tax=Cinchona calisaya TaxID=153742 RepID=A0ABD2Z0D8_9GENT